MPKGPPKVKRRVRIPDKPNYSLNLWSIMKNCIGRELSKIPMPVGRWGRAAPEGCFPVHGWEVMVRGEYRQSWVSLSQGGNPPRAEVTDSERSRQRGSVLTRPGDPRSTSCPGGWT